MTRVMCILTMAFGMLLTAPVRAQAPTTPPAAERPPTAPTPAPAPAAKPASPARPVTGLFLQGQVAFNLTAYAGALYYGSFNVLPNLRVGYQGRTWAFAAEVNYSTFNVHERGSDGGIHLFSIGLNLQPTVWRSRKNDVKLAAVFGAGVGTVAFSGDGSDDNIILGHLNLGLGVHYFPSRHFGAGIEPGLRVQFIRADDTLVTVALLYVALSVEAVIGR